MWRHWNGLAQAWGSATYDWTLGQILPGSREEGCHQNLTEARQREDPGLPLGRNLTVAEYTMGLPRRGIRAIRTLSPVQGLTGDPGELTPVLGLASDCSAQSDCRGSLEDSPGFTIRGTELEEKKGTCNLGEGEWGRQAWQLASSSRPPLNCYPTHGKKLAQREGGSVSPRPAALQMSAKEVPCANAWEETTLRVKWALTSRGLTSVADKELFIASEAPGAVHRYAHALTGHSNAKAGSASSKGSACRFHHLIAEGCGGNLGHVSRPGSQDNVRVGRPEHKALFAYRKRLEVPDPFDRSERGQERCLNRQ